MTLTNTLAVDEGDVIRLILQFLHTRKLHKTTRNLERESGITNCNYSPDVLFLRQLILDGEWDAILTFAQPLEKIEGFDVRTFRYLVLKEKFMEVLYFKSGIEGVPSSYSIEDLIKCLNQLEKDCPCKSDYTKLCWLLTVPDLYEQPEYLDWNPEMSRMECFDQVVELLRDVMHLDNKASSTKMAHNPAKDRLINLVVKGMCFESCIDYCHQRALIGDLDEGALSVSTDLLNGVSQESTGNFLSWLSCLPQESFVAPFEPMSVDVELQKTDRVKRMHLSKKRLRNESENLSKSLSLSARPSTAGNNVNSHTNGASNGTEPCERSQSALARVTTAFNSLTDFHPRQDNTHFQPIPNVPADKEGDMENVQNINKDPSKVIHNRDQRDDISNRACRDNSTHSRVITNGVCQDKEGGETFNALQSAISSKPSTVDPVRVIYDSQDSIDHLKKYQESSVLKQLEEHEQRQMERRLLLLDDKGSNGHSNGTSSSEIVQTSQHEPEIQSNQQQTNNKLYDNTPIKPSQAQHPPTKNSHQRASPVGKEVSPCFKDSYVVEVASNFAVTSTPKTKKIPEPLNFDSISNHTIGHQEMQHLGKQQLYDKQSINQHPAHRDSQFPKTPITNALPKGHWVALADGSGVMNTSTPKSCREKMYKTPVPPASPVCVQSIVNGLPSDATAANNVPHAGEVYSLDEETTDFTDENDPTPRKGPKINGVRRTLMSTGPPMSRNKGTPIPPEERREAKTPRQDRSAVPKNEGSKTNMPRGREKQTVAKKTSREEPKNVKSISSTFVVDHAASKGAENKPENANGKQMTDKSNGVENLVNHKPISHPLPYNTNLLQNERSKLLERQRQHMQSSPHSLRFSAVASIEDVQAIRAVTFHPSGELFAIGSNSKTLRVCSASGLNTYKKTDSDDDSAPPQPSILFKRSHYHKGSIYCIAWNSTGNLIATGSNDKTIKVLHFDVDNYTQIGPDMELNIHGGTVRDVAFAPRTGGSTVLVSGGAGNGNIKITDCTTSNTIGQLKGHSGHIMSVFAAKDDIIVSGSNDNTVRLWDLRSQRCIDAIATGDSCVASVCGNQSGTLLASGHEDGGCMIYDITAGRTLQFFKPHTMDCRSVRFSPDGHYLMTGSYDTSIILLDLQQNLESNIPPYSVVAQHRDKVIQCRWHPYLMAFVSSSADKTARLWTLDC